MVDGHTLFDYNVGLNEIIQILVSKPDTVTEQSEVTSEEPQLNQLDNSPVRFTNWMFTSSDIADYRC